MPSSDYSFDHKRWNRRTRFDRAGKIMGIGYGLFIAIVAILVVTSIGVGIWSNTKTDTITCSVTDKDRTARAKGGSDMRVYTSDCGTLAVADSIIEGRWDSADFYAKIEKGKRYEFRTRGVRVPFFSMFPNIITAKEVPVS